MRRDEMARAVLALDAAGCAATAIGVGAVDALLRPVDPSLRSRRPIVAALTVTALACASGAARRRPPPAALATAAAINGAWTVACLAGSRGRPSRLGSTLVLATAALDASVGATQWALRGSGRS
jgi:hypothetical protein